MPAFAGMTDGNAPVPFPDPQPLTPAYTDSVAEIG